MKTKQAKSVPRNGAPPFAPAKEETRERLLEAAQQVFVEHGFYDATVREICQRARVNLALVNYHFGDKLQLYIEVFRRVMNRPALDVLKGVNDPDLDPVTLLRDFVAGFLRMKKKENACDILMQQESLRPTPAMEFITENSMRPAYAAVCALIGRILKLPAAHETTRLVTHSVIAQIKHFGEPERLLARVDPTILSGKTDEELANFIIRFALAGSYMHDMAKEGAIPRQEKGPPPPKQRKVHSVGP